MAHASGVGAGKKYRGLPGEEEYAHQTYVRRFEEIYSNDVNPESLYKAQINNFVRFAKIHPHVAFLLEQLRLIYEHLDVALDLFKAVRFTGLDPFGYFNAEDVDYEHRSCLVHLRSALDQWDEGAFGPIFRETARDILYHARTPDRKAIVEELLSEETALQLQRVPTSKEAGIWAIRRELALKEEMLTHSLQRIQRSLDHHEKLNEACVPYSREAPRPASRFATSPPRQGRDYSLERKQRRARKSSRSISSLLRALLGLLLPSIHRHPKSQAYIR